MVISVRESVGPTAIVRLEGLSQIKYSSDTIKNRTRNLPTYSAVPHPTASQRALYNKVSSEFYFSWYRRKMWYIIHLKLKLFWDYLKTVQYQEKNCRYISYCRRREGLYRRIFINLLSPSGRLCYSRWVEMHRKKKSANNNGVRILYRNDGTSLSGKTLSWPGNYDMNFCCSKSTVPIRFYPLPKTMSVLWIFK